MGILIYITDYPFHRLVIDEVKQVAIPVIDAAQMLEEASEEAISLLIDLFLVVKHCSIDGSERLHRVSELEYIFFNLVGSFG